ncbi:dihydroorotase [Lachnospiraceae bacterium RM5]|nr:dihydroorotase [Lachnospiraceae bacterium RM5]
MIIIKNGTIVNPLNNFEGKKDIAIEGKTIVSIEDNIRANDNDTVIDATNLIIAPGLLDTHVHFRDPGFTYKEDIITGANAAKRGGFTSVVCMANTKPTVDNIETLNYIKEKAEETNIKIYQTATITKGLKGEELTDMEILAKNGAVGFTDDGIPIMNEKVLLEAMNKAKELNMPVSLHEEDPLFVYGAGVNKGKISEGLGYPGADHIAEDIMVARDSMLALKTMAKVCIQHISSKISVDIVRNAKKYGADIYAEATPHHFTLTEEDVLKYGTNARMNPPLREQSDKEAIIEGLKDGTIDMIVTDHAPHSKEEKDRDLKSAPSGITGLETSLALGIKSLVMPGHITLMKLIKLMSTNPAKFYNLPPASVEVGKDADLVLFNPEEIWEVKEEEFASKATNSPFIGWNLPGKIHYTICNGMIVYKAL